LEEREYYVKKSWNAGISMAKHNELGPVSHWCAAWLISWDIAQHTEKMEFLAFFIINWTFMQDI
jgi:hypothetical protein